MILNSSVLLLFPCTLLRFWNAYFAIKNRLMISVSRFTFLSLNTLQTFKLLHLFWFLQIEFAFFFLLVTIIHSLFFSWLLFLSFWFPLISYLGVPLHSLMGLSSTQCELHILYWYDLAQRIINPGKVSSSLCVAVQLEWIQWSNTCMSYTVFFSFLCNNWNPFSIRMQAICFPV